MSLLVDHLHKRFGSVVALDDLAFEVPPGQVFGFLGANGAGKTTTLRALSGMIHARGTFCFAGKSLLGAKPERIARAGIAHVPQGRGTLMDLTVEENLRLGAYTRRDREVMRDIDRWFTVFPRLADRRGQTAGSMSGGEQQMLAIARALMGRPKLLLLDEPSLGLAPLVVRDIFAIIASLRTSGAAVLLVEQNARAALQVADYGYVLETGELALEGPSAELASNPRVAATYLGQGAKARETPLDA
jgi:branched-chain amino acid transport system ATP-binding protein